MRLLDGAAGRRARWGVKQASAYLYATTPPLVNRFTAAKLAIHLEEPLWQPDSKLTPGVMLRKDPTVTVVAGSEECYVIVQVSQSDPQAWAAAGIEYGYAAETGFTAGLHPRWLQVPGTADLWYRLALTSDMNQILPVFDLVNVPDGLTSEQLAAAANNQITISAWAVQADGVNGPGEAVARLGLGRLD